MFQPWAEAKWESPFTASRNARKFWISGLLKVRNKHTEAVVSRCFLEGVLKNFAKFTGKYMSQGLFLNKVACLQPATALKGVSCICVLQWILQSFQEHLVIEQLQATTSGIRFLKIFSLKLKVYTTNEPH